MTYEQMQLALSLVEKRYDTVSDANYAHASDEYLSELSDFILWLKSEMAHYEAFVLEQAERTYRSRGGKLMTYEESFIVARQRLAAYKESRDKESRDDAA